MGIRIINKKEDAFNALMKFPGWGNPNDGFWFVGIEERGGWNRESYKIDFISDDCFVKHVYQQIERDYCIACSDGKYYFNYDEKSVMERQNFYDNISKLMCLLTDDNEGDYKKYKKDFLCRKCISSNCYNTYLTNIFPFGKNNTKEAAWRKVQKDYKLLFGISADTFSDYKKLFSDQDTIRFTFLQDHWIKSKPKITFCFGIGNLKNFINCFIPQKKIYVQNVYKKRRKNEKEVEEVYFRYLYSEVDNQLIIFTYHISQLYYKIRDFLLNSLKIYLSDNIWVPLKQENFPEYIVKQPELYKID